MTTGRDRREYQAAWYQEHRELVRDQTRARRAAETHEQKAARAEYHRKWRAARVAADPAGVRQRQWANALRAFYGIDVDTYTKLFEEQGGVCALCGRPETRAKRGRPMLLSVDHDHAHCPGKYVRCGGACIRGLLCQSCNAALGGFNDDVELMRRAITYIEAKSAH